MVKVLVFYYDGNEFQIKNTEVDERFVRSVSAIDFDLPASYDINLVLVGDIQYDKAFIMGEEVI